MELRSYSNALAAFNNAISQDNNYAQVSAMSICL
jgi:hypothetical protein